MYCKHCYADLERAVEGRCARCNKPFDESDPATCLSRPFPSRRRIVVHTLVMVTLATGVSFVVAMFLGMAQLKHLNSGH